MNRILWMSLALFISVNAHAFDSFSLMRGFGTQGNLGHEVLELNCVKKKCELSVVRNENIVSKKVLTRKEADAYFKLAKKALTAKKSHMPASTADSQTPTQVNLEWKGKKFQSKTLNMNILSLETKLRARIRS
jgi:hypothetical protein